MQLDISRIIRQEKSGQSLIFVSNVNGAGRTYENITLATESVTQIIVFARMFYWYLGSRTHYRRGALPNEIQSPLSFNP